MRMYEEGIGLEVKGYMVIGDGKVSVMRARYQWWRNRLYREYGYRRVG